MEQTPNWRVKKQFTLCVPSANIGTWDIEVCVPCDNIASGHRPVKPFKFVELNKFYTFVTPDKILFTWQDNHQIGEAVQIWC